MSEIDAERRMSFDRAAAAYEATRPSYPDVVFDDILERSNATNAVEVGAGTGKATVELARRGVEVVALEPGPQLAAILRSKTIGLPVTVVETTFEAWTGEDYDLVFSAQAFHWVEPAVRYTKAHDVLRPGGSLALIMNEKAVMRDQSLRDELDAAYAKWFGWPAWDNHFIEKTIESWSGEIEGSGLFQELQVTQVPWSATYTSDQFIALIDTYSDHAVRPDTERLPCYADIRAAIDRRGGSVEIPYVTLAFFAVRS